jgi:hypothetical protein
MPAKKDFDMYMGPMFREIFFFGWAIKKIALI